MPNPLFGKRTSSILPKPEIIESRYLELGFPVPKGSNPENWRDTVQKGDFLEVRLDQTLIDAFQSDFDEKDRCNETIKALESLIHQNQKWMSVKVLKVHRTTNDVVVEIVVEAPMISKHAQSFFPRELE